jgi:hypothetical protein
MPTEEQCERIATLLEQTDLARQDLAFEDARWAIYERVDEDEANVIIGWLLGQKAAWR